VPVLLLTVFAAVIPSSIILPMLPFIGQKFGATSFQVSILFTLMPAIVIVMAPVWGRLSDRYGRKPVFMGALGASALTFVAFGMADTLQEMFYARALQGVTGGSVAIAFAMVADSTTHDNRAKYLGYVSAAMAMAFFVGPMLGGFLMGSDLESFSHARPAYVAAGLCIVATVIGLALLKETRSGAGRRMAAIARQTGPHQTPDTDEDEDDAPPVSVVLGRVGLAALIAQFFIGGYVSGQDQFVFAFWAQGLHGWGPDDVSFGMAAMGLGYMVATGGLVGPLTKRLGDLGAYLFGAVLDAAGLCLLLLSDNVWLGAAGLWLAVIGIGVWNTVLSSVMSKVSPPDQVGYMLGLSNGFSMAGRVAGPLIAGSFFIDISPEVPFMVSLGLVAIVIANAVRLTAAQARARSARSG
jgi:MFS family permease